VKDFFRHNGILILIAAILLALVTAVVSMLFGGVADPLSNLVGILTTPVRNGITAVTNWAEEKYNDAFELEQMKEELAGLKAQRRAGGPGPGGGGRPPGERAPAQPAGAPAQGVVLRQGRRHGHRPLHLQLGVHPHHWQGQRCGDCRG
jgi:hypothetical protein